MHHRCSLMMSLVAVLIGAAGCRFEVGGGSTIAASSVVGNLVVTGTMVDAGLLTPCPVFEAENGLFYHLLQGRELSDVQFARITRLGTTSSLEVRLRRDVDLRCQVDDAFDVLEVADVLLVSETIGQ